MACPLPTFGGEGTAAQTQAQAGRQPGCEKPSVRQPHVPRPMLALTDAFLGEPACVWHLGLRSGGQEGGKVTACLCVHTWAEVHAENVAECVEHMSDYGCVARGCTRVCKCK